VRLSRLRDDRLAGLGRARDHRRRGDQGRCDGHLLVLGADAVLAEPEARRDRARGLDPVVGAKASRPLARVRRHEHGHPPRRRRRGAAAAAASELVGRGAGSGTVTLHRGAAGSGVTLTAPPSLSVPGTLTLRASASRGAAAADSSGFAVLTRGADVRRVAYWVHVSARALSREPHVL